VIKTEIVADLAHIDPQQWEALIARCPDSTIFQSKGWITSWWATFARPGMRIHCITAYDGGRLVGFAPLYMTSRQCMGLRLMELRFLGEGPSDYNVLSVHDGDPEITDRLVEGMRRELENNVSIMLVDVPQFSSLAFRLSAPELRGVAGPRKISTMPCPRLRLAGNSAGVAAILKKDSLRRHYKALSKIGAVSARHHSSPEAICALLPDLYQQHVARWSGTSFPSLFLNDANRRFYEALANSLGKEGKIVLTEIRAGEKLAALHFGLRSRGEFIWYKPAFDPEFTRHGPGEVLLKILIEQAQSDGCSAFDFTRGDEVFKSRFATSVDYNATYEWLPRRAPQLFHRTARELRRSLARRWRAYMSRGRAAEDGLSEGKRLLLLDLPAAVAGPVGALLAEEKFEVDLAAARPTPSQGPPNLTKVQRLPTASDSLPTALRRLQAEQSYSLLVPFSVELVSTLSVLPDNDVLRVTSPVPRSSVLDAARREFPLGANEPDLAPWSVQCLCDHGRLAWYRTLGGSGASKSLAWVVSQHAKRVLEQLGWHGFATLQLEVLANGHPAVRHIMPFLLPSETDAVAIARFVAAAWAMTRLRRVAPQPEEFKFQAG
jgi:CelD/BcsL family acetyltransferase involved in cellulose biosynthesis